MYFDTHCHLNSEQLYENRDEFIKHALDNQVEMMVVVGYDLESSKKAVEIAKEHSFIYAAVGIGPNDCLNTTTQDLQIIDEYLNEPKVVALGEIGLDYYWDDVPSDKQKEIFQLQVDLAKKHQKPIIIHCRDAYEDTYEVLKRNGHPGIMHCYSGSVEMDCPYLTPHPFRGKLNEPANVVYIAQEIAKLKNMEIESVASQTTFNAKKVFGIK